MPRAVATLLLTCFASCAKSPLTVVAPAPMNFHSSRGAGDAARGAAMALVGAGFRVVQTDAVGQAIAATRTATGNGNDEYVVCTVPMRTETIRETALTINLRAKPAPSDSGSSVALDSKVLTSYSVPRDSTPSKPNTSDCVSNGKMEKQLANALR